MQDYSKGINWGESLIMRKVSMFTLALLPILGWYAIPFPVALGYAIMLLLMTIIIFRSMFKVNVLPTPFLLVFLYVSFTWIYHHNYELWTLIPTGGWIFFIFVLSLLGGILSFDIELLKKYMRWVVQISVILFWIQLFFVLTTGTPKFCCVPPITSSFTYEGLSYSELVSLHLSGGHPCSIFLEKSYMAYYLITYLSLEWFSCENRNKWLTKWVFLTFITLVALRSGSGIVGASILLLGKVITILSNASLSRRIKTILCVFPVLLMLFFVYIRSEIGQSMLSRSEEFTTENSSGFARVVGGYLMFQQLSDEEQIVGISDAQDRFSVQKADGTTRFYINGVQTILITLGYIGAILFLIFYTYLFLKVGIMSRMCILILLSMSLLESNYLNPYMILLTIIPCADFYLSKHK